MLDVAALEETQRRTIERFNGRQDRIAKHEGFGATEGALKITEAFLPRLSATINQELRTVGAAYSALALVVNHIDPNVLAAVTLSRLLHSIAMADPVRAVCHAIGRAVQSECWAAGLLNGNGKLHAQVKRAVKTRSPRYRDLAARKIAAQAGYRTAGWNRALVVKAGGFFLDCALKALPEVFTLAGENEKFPQIAEGALDLAAAAVDEALVRAPSFVPTKMRPQPWTRFHAGGYWDERARFKAPFVRVYHKDAVARITAAMRDGLMKPHVDAVNSLQDVAWQINPAVFGTVQWCYDHAVPVKGLPPHEDIAQPARLPDAEWADETKRYLHRYRIGQVKARNRELASERVLYMQDMAIARDLLGAPFWTPMNCDWRGRVYGVPHFNFQRDDRVRALFQFAEGMPIGEEGLWWLKVHVANCGDFEKISKQPFEERVAWTDEHLKQIASVAWDAKSTSSLSWWTQADKPFLFLAACTELASAIAAGPSYITRLPTSFDGSCSGLQHLCAMTRAAEGELVNLTPGEMPQDVYQTVAELVRTRLTADATGRSAGSVGDLANLCLSAGITRTLVKRNVMTYSYSSEEYGMMQQHLEDTMHPLELDVLSGKLSDHPYAHPDDTRLTQEGREYTVVGKTAAKYLAQHIYAAIETVVHRPAQAMTYLQKLAKALAHEGKPLQWTTPTGLPWINRYHKPVVKFVELWLSDTRVRVKVATDTQKPIDKDKAANGVAPNFVHALDASHLLLTANACVKEGITNIATVHDSFGCLAPQAARFNAIIREEFVRLYEDHDVLAEVLEAAKHDLTEHNWDKLPDVPERGPLDLQEVLNAKFCFA